MINEKYVDYLRMFLVADENDFIVQNFDMLYILLSYIKIEYDRQNIVFDKKQIDKLAKKLKIYNISNIFEFVNNFNKTFNINVELEDLINKGIIIFDSRDYEKMVEEVRRKIMNNDGFCSKDGNTIWIKNKGSLNDAFTLIHELSHYKDRYDKSNTFTRYWFTEALAMTEEMIAAHLSNNKMEMIYNFEVRIIDSINCADGWFKVLPIIITYQKFSDVSEESYGMIFDKSNYNKDLNNFNKLMKNKFKSLDDVDIENKEKQVLDIFYNLLGGLKYVVGLIVAIHLFTRYLCDNNYMNEIQKMHKLINEMSVGEFINYLGVKEMSLDDVGDPVVKFMKDVYVTSKNNVKCL